MLTARNGSRWKVFLTIALIGLCNGALAQQYDVHLDNVERLEGSENYFSYNYTTEKISEMKLKFSAHIQQHKELDDSYSVVALISRADLAEGSEYEVVMDLKKPLCEWMKTIYKTYFYEELEPLSNLPHFDTCPLPAAEYWLKDYVLDTEPYKEMMQEGRWKVEMKLMKGDEVCSGVITTTTVKPVA
ncbi:uncharacterized protein LOC128271889 [Anopheles cruzii]|uniref:uncharacterized protein LOC128271889 n=1 Tax=Anopheles cruzii TaxID=68878 RepID=UPI0022EC3CD9|nr:uncharacterized protein LOC128271889 [Anopheles cruzii]